MKSRNVRNVNSNKFKTLKKNKLEMNNTKTN